jgi:hypothetical protein
MEVDMVPSPSSIQRVRDIGTKSAQIDGLIADIVPLLGDLDEKALREIKSFLDTKVNAARHALAKESTKVYLRGTALRPEKP